MNWYSKHLLRRHLNPLLHPRWLERPRLFPAKEVTLLPITLQTPKPRPVELGLKRHPHLRLSIRSHVRDARTARQLEL